MNRDYKKPRPLNGKDETVRQCIWESWDWGNKDVLRCDKEAVGRFFCNKHMAIAAKVEAGSFQTYSLGRMSSGGYGHDR